MKIYLNYFKTRLFQTAGLCLFCNFLFIVNASEESTRHSMNTQNLVILQYHHVSTETPSSTSVSPDTFEQHMAFLQKNYHIIDLAEALDKLKAGDKLPDRSVAITFDDGYKNILENGHPILQKYNFPYTIFINPAIIGESSQQLTWSQIKQMKPLATFANHTLDHAHLLANGNQVKTSSWLVNVMNDINQAEALIEANLGYSKKWLAFPFGEFNMQLKEELRAQGYIGFGQQSGAVSILSDFGALPRFPAAGIYANLDSLQTKLNSFAMPVESVSPADNEFKSGDRLEYIELTILSSDVRLSALTCYFNGATLPISITEKLVKVSVKHTLKAGRARVNCTAPSEESSGRFYWYSFPIFTATKEGNFLD